MGLRMCTCRNISRQVNGLRIATDSFFGGREMREGPDMLSLRRKWGNEEEKRKISVVGQRKEPKLGVEQVNLSEVVKSRGSYSGKAKA